MIKLKRVKGSALTHDELDDNFNGSVNLFDDQTVDGIKTFLDSPVVPTPISSDSSGKVASTSFVKTAITNSTGGNFVTVDTAQSITGQKTFNQLIKSDGIISILNTNGGGYIDVNDGQISIGTGLNNAGAPIPEISIENQGYGMAVVFNPSSQTQFMTRVYLSGGLYGSGIGADALGNDLTFSGNNSINLYTTGKLNIESNWGFIGTNNFIGTKGFLEAKESWSTDWDTNNVIDISKNTMLIKTLGASAYNFTFKTFSLYQQIAYTIASASIYSKTIKLVLTNTSAATSITWDPKIQWIHGAPVPLSGTMIVVLELSIGSAGVINAWGYTV